MASAQVQPLAQALEASISPDASIRRSAEAQLSAGLGQPGFLILLLQLVNEAAVPKTTRQTGAVYFKNAAKKLCAGEEVSAAGCAGVSKTRVMKVLDVLS